MRLRYLSLFGALLLRATNWVLADEDEDEMATMVTGNGNDQP